MHRRKIEPPGCAVSVGGREKGEGANEKVKVENKIHRIQIFRAEARAAGETEV